MWDTLAEEHSQHFNYIGEIWGEDLTKMDGESNEQQTKRERLRTRWTPALDKIFADIVVEQIRQGKRPNNIFDKKTWTQIREEFNRQTGLSFNNKQLRKHLNVLRTRYHSFQSIYTQNDAMPDPCYAGFEMWEDIGVSLLSAQAKMEPAKTKECPIYEQLCTIFADSGVDGKYAQSSHYGGLNKSAGIDQFSSEGANPSPKTPSKSKSMLGNGSSPQNVSKSMADKKRKRTSEVGSISDQSHGLIDTMATAFLDMIESSRLRTATKPQMDERFTITNCIKALDKIEGVHDKLYYAALDVFEENPNFRELFLSLQNDYLRLTWLQGKCAPFSY
ncbi:L10-interacting MYB domain-containing protein-like isoform X1 [Salvia hispanica]|uniref:L10-interacting MYB domain-containing protein-like isoform X1 n=2 Tax=Salvia hispanica TaxID=49212 RepID=UPI00200994E7|nr:L10-interacting MYB domain-containing protein-like isoform X1 [Salvia hispanica]XP_047976816.1 L10-interacting MYB domain-containing protein-like isoform X1 [Salvia hispanica]XP_047976817.1 L10-interacting MYB domain-containing protein-like isoform X1 [Salvia hispanica]